MNMVGIMPQQQQMMMAASMANSGGNLQMTTGQCNWISSD
jgi:hypothetical protein